MSARIGNPKNFFDIFLIKYLKIHKKTIFPDHYNYSINELNNFISFAEKNIVETPMVKRFFKNKKIQSTKN